MNLSEYENMIEDFVGRKNARFSAFVRMVIESEASTSEEKVCFIRERMLEDRDAFVVFHNSLDLDEEVE